VIKLLHKPLSYSGKVPSYEKMFIDLKLNPINLNQKKNFLLTLSFTHRLDNLNIKNLKFTIMIKFRVRLTLKCQNNLHSLDLLPLPKKDLFSDSCLFFFVLSLNLRWRKSFSWSTSPHWNKLWVFSFIRCYQPSDRNQCEVSLREMK
jgi:hypothetical protein